MGLESINGVEHNLSEDALESCLAQGMLVSVEV